MRARRLAGQLLPPIVAQSLRRRRDGELRFVEVDGDWAAAAGGSDGYDAAEVLERVVAANRAVVEGRAAFERDSVLFDVAEPPLATLVALLRSALVDEGRIEVIDVGGSLGTTYRRCRPLLDPLASVRWHVVEQPSFVAAGRAEFETDELRFVESISEVPVATVPPTYVLASVLQYLPDPHGLLAELVARPGRHLVIERTPVWDGPDDLLTVQHAPRAVYDASYPAWILSRRRLEASLGSLWRLVCQTPSPEGSMVTAGGRPFEFVDQLHEAP